MSLLILIALNQLQTAQRVTVFGHPDNIELLQSSLAHSDTEFFRLLQHTFRLASRFLVCRDTRKVRLQQNCVAQNSVSPKKKLM